MRNRVPAVVSGSQSAALTLGTRGKKLYDAGKACFDLPEAAEKCSAAAGGINMQDFKNLWNVVSDPGALKSAYDGYFNDPAIQDQADDIGLKLADKYSAYGVAYLQGLARQTLAINKLFDTYKEEYESLQKALSGYCECKSLIEGIESCAGLGALLLAL